MPSAAEVYAAAAGVTAVIIVEVQRIAGEAYETVYHWMLPYLDGDEEMTAIFAVWVVGVVGAHLLLAVMELVDLVVKLFFNAVGALNEMVGYVARGR